ncbi:MAG: hypothetical protein ACKVOK_03720 [Flavobacteriales bacterium]
MRFSIYTLLLLLLVISCTTPQSSTIQTKPAEVVFKNVTIQAWQTSQYCGGARPSDEMLQEFQTPKPLSGQLCFIRKSETNKISSTPVASATTDNLGKINIALAPGTYCLVLPNKVDSAAYKMYLTKFGEATPNYSAIDKKCLDQWFKKPELVFTVTDAKQPTTAEFTIHHPCSWHTIPCADYSGPLPP